MAAVLTGAAGVEIGSAKACAQAEVASDTAMAASAGASFIGVTLNQFSTIAPGLNRHPRRIKGR